MENAETLQFITHRDSSQTDLSEAVEEIKLRLIQEGNLVHTRVDEKIALLEQLTQFEFGRFLLMHRGINGYWTQYIIQYPKLGKLSGKNGEGQSLTRLEKWLLDHWPVLLATRERFNHFQNIIQSHIQSDHRLASIPCGLMDDLLQLDYKNVQNIKLIGIDLDENSLDLARKNAHHYGLSDRCEFFKCDAWDLSIENEFDLITSNGLNIYEKEDEKVNLLYQAFWNALKSNGKLVTSFLTPPPLLDPNSPWDLQKIPSEDLRIQRIIFGDILQAKWQAFRSPEKTKEQLTQVGFKNIQFIYDRQRLFPTVVAEK